MTEPVNPDPAGPRPADPPAPEPTRSLTGLVVGGLSLGGAQVLKGVRLLEEAAAEAPPPEPSDPETSTTAATTSPPPFTQADLVRQGMAGFVIDSQRRMTRRAATLEADVRRLSRRIQWSRLPGSGRASQTLAGRMARMEARGRRELSRYAAIGQAQEHDAARVAGTAFHRVADTGVDEITTITVTRVVESDVVHELFISQSSTMFEDLVDLIRERADALDDALEHLARRFFRRGRPRPEGGVPWLPAAHLASSAAPEKVS